MKIGDVFRIMAICFMLVAAVLSFFGQAGAVDCDVDGDSRTGLPEAVFSLQVAAALRQQGDIQCDVNGDNKAGLHEAVYALRVTTALTPPAISYGTVGLTNKTAAGVSESISAPEKITTIINRLNLHKAFSQTTRENPLTAVIASFSCGAVALESTTSVKFTFNGQCGIAGTVIITPVLQSNTFTISYDITSPCVIKGTTETTITKVEGSQITISHKFTDMTICGQKFSGEITVVFDSATDNGAIVSLSGKMTCTVDTATVSITDFSYSTANGMSGNAAITDENGQSHTCVITGIKVDPTCGLPKSGTLKIDDITFDFSSTTCENKTVSVKVGNLPYYTVSMEEAKTLLQTLYSSN